MNNQAAVAYALKYLTSHEKVTSYIAHWQIRNDIFAGLIGAWQTGWQATLCAGQSCLVHQNEGCGLL